MLHLHLSTLRSCLSNPSTLLNKVKVKITIFYTSVRLPSIKGISKLADDGGCFWEENIQWNKKLLFVISSVIKMKILIDSPHYVYNSSSLQLIDTF